MQQIKSVHYKLIFILLFLIDVVFIVLFEVNQGRNYKEGLAFAFMSLFLFAILMYFISHNEDIMLKGNNNVLYFYLGVIVSGNILIASVYAPIYHLWIAGCLILGVAYSINMALAFIAVYLSIYSMCFNIAIEQIIYYMLMGIVLCLLITYYPSGQGLKQKIVSYFYFVIIAACCHTTLYMITNYLDYSLLKRFEFGYMLIITFVLVSFIYFISSIGNSIDSLVTDISDEEEGAENIPGDSLEQVKELVHPNAPLIVELKNNLPNVYKHSFISGKISGDAARCIQADYYLCSAGSLYHEVGKLVKMQSNQSNTEDNQTDENAYNNSLNKDYVTLGIELLAQNDFPQQLIDIVSSHNLKHSYPTSKESAIVYLTEKLINSIYYMKNVRKAPDFSKEVLIRNIFAKLIIDGTLSASGLSLGEYETLKKYYIDNL